MDALVFAGLKCVKSFVSSKENVNKWKREVQMDEDRDDLIKIVEDLDKVGHNRELQPDEIDLIRQDAMKRIRDFNYIVEVKINS